MSTRHDTAPSEPLPHTPAAATPQAPQESTPQASQESTPQVPQKSTPQASQESTPPATQDIARQAESPDAVANPEAPAPPAPAASAPSHWTARLDILLALGTLIVAILFGLASYPQHPLLQPDLTALGGGFDYFHYFATTRALKSGLANVYDPAYIEPFSRTLSQGRWAIHDNHLPAFYLFYFNLADLDFPVGFPLHNYIQLSLLAAGLLALCRRLLSPPALAWVATGLLVMASVSVGPGCDNIWLGQVGFALTAALCLTLVFYLLNYDAAAGVVLSLAILAKMYPALLLIFFLRQRRWRVVVFTLLSLAALIISAGFQWGFGHNLNYLQMMHTQQSFNASVANQSLMGFLAWATGNFGNSLAASTTGKTIHAFILVGAVCLLWFRLPHSGTTPRAQALEYSLWLTASALLAPLSWSHHHILLCVPWVVFLTVIAHSPAPTTWSHFSLATRWALAGLALISLIFILEGETAQPIGIRILHYKSCLYHLGTAGLAGLLVTNWFCLRAETTKIPLP